MAIQKIVHLHLKNGDAEEQTDFYFGCLSAIFDRFDDSAVGIKYKSLTNALRGRDFYENKRVTIRVSTLITKPKNTNEL